MVGAGGTSLEGTRNPKCADEDHFTYKVTLGCPVRGEDNCLRVDAGPYSWHTLNINGHQEF